MSEFLSEWWETKHRLKPNTLHQYELYVNKYIVPFFGKTKLNAITPAMLQKVINRIAINYPMQAKQLCTALHNIFKLATDRGYILKNPVSVVKKAKRKNNNNTY